MWVLVNIGCIECGVSSAVVSVYPSRESAEVDAAILDDVLGWREGGQNRFEVFKLPGVGEMTDEYREALKQKAKTE